MIDGQEGKSSPTFSISRDPVEISILSEEMSLQHPLLGEDFVLCLEKSAGFDNRKILDVKRLCKILFLPTRNLTHPWAFISAHCQ